MVTQILCWIELHPGLASWLQAFGALIAIFTTLFLWRHDVNERSKQSELAAFGLAVSLVDELYDLEYRMTWLIEKFPVVPNIVPVFGRNGQLYEGMRVPPKIENLDGRLHELGALALPIQSLVLGMRRVEKLAKRKSLTVSFGKEETKEYDEEIITYVYSLQIDIERTLRMVNDYFAKARQVYSHA